MIGRKTLAELQAEDIPKATAANVGVTLTGKDDEVRRAARIFDAYFANFVAFTEPTQMPQKCIQCGRDLCGLFGTFTFGICYGEGTCGNCGHPCRACHEILDPADGKTFATLTNMVLQYHPSVLVPAEEEVSVP